MTLITQIPDVCMAQRWLSQRRIDAKKTVLPEKYSNVEFPLWLHAIPNPAWREEVWEEGFSLWDAEGDTHVEPLQPPPAAWGPCLSPGRAENPPSNSPRVSVMGDFPGLGVIPHGAKAITAL